MAVGRDPQTITRSVQYIVTYRPTPSDSISPKVVRQALRTVLGENGHA
jgi:hypothetical protein